MPYPYYNAYQKKSLFDILDGERRDCEVFIGRELDNQDPYKGKIDELNKEYEKKYTILSALRTTSEVGIVATLGAALVVCGLNDFSDMSTATKVLAAIGVPTTAVTAISKIGLNKVLKDYEVAYSATIHGVVSCGSSKKNIVNRIKDKCIGDDEIYQDLYVVDGKLLKGPTEQELATEIVMSYLINSKTKNGKENANFLKHIESLPDNQKDVYLKSIDLLLKNDKEFKELYNKNSKVFAPIVGHKDFLRYDEGGENEK